MMLESEKNRGRLKGKIAAQGHDGKKMPHAYLRF
jgi:hypothetical protein